MEAISRRDRIEGALIGLLIGDALGVPYEFHPPEDIPKIEAIEYVPPVGFERAHEGTPPATWSDDGAQALCLLASLLHENTLDLTDFSNRLLNWYDAGYMAVDNRVFDIGITTGGAFLNLKAGYLPEQAGGIKNSTNGNGSLMRVLPLALWHQGSDADLIRDSQLQSCITHRHHRSQVCCALYCLWARYILNEIPEPWNVAVKVLSESLQDDKDRIAELEFHIRPHESYSSKGTGYVVDSLHSARECLKSSNYEQAVKKAIAFGNDTDTTACVTGGIAGLIYGINGIPERWKNDLRGRELYEPLLAELLKKIDC